MNNDFPRSINPTQLIKYLGVTALVGSSNLARASLVNSTHIEHGRFNPSHESIDDRLMRAYSEGCSMIAAHDSENETQIIIAESPNIVNSGPSDEHRCAGYSTFAIETGLDDSIHCNDQLTFQSIQQPDQVSKTNKNTQPPAVAYSSHVNNVSDIYYFKENQSGCVDDIQRLLTIIKCRKNAELVINITTKDFWLMAASIACFSAGNVAKIFDPTNRLNTSFSFTGRSLYTAIQALCTGVLTTISARYLTNVLDNSCAPFSAADTLPGYRSAMHAFLYGSAGSGITHGIAQAGTSLAEPRLGTRLVSIIEGISMVFANTFSSAIGAMLVDSRAWQHDSFISTFEGNPLHMQNAYGMMWQVIPATVVWMTTPFLFRFIENNALGGQESASALTRPEITPLESHARPRPQAPIPTQEATVQLPETGQNEI